MTKYSTGDSLSSGSTACELCGKSTEDLRTANVAGAQLEVCSACASHGETERSKQSRSGNRSDQDRKRRAAQNTAQMTDRANAGSKHWEREGTNYDDDPLPYLVSGYGDRVSEAREAAGLSTGELADELDVPEKDLRTVEEGRATSAGIGGSVIEALEERFDVQLAQ